MWGWVGYAGLALAGIGGVGVMAVALHTGGPRDGGRLWGAVFATLPLLAGLLLAHGAALARGGFAWVLRDGSGAARAALVLLSVLAAVLVVGFSAAVRDEPSGQVPWALAPVQAWAHWVWLPVLLGQALLGLAPALRPAARLLWQGPSLAVGALSLALCAAMLLQLLVSQAQQGQTQLREEQAFQDERDERIRQQVQQADPQRDFLSLLPQASRFERADIRALALAKLRSHPDLQGALAQVLQGPQADETFAFLEAEDPPDPAALAPRVRDGMGHLARELRRAVARTHTLRPDDFEPVVRRSLAVADRYARYGVDFRPALEELRDAFDAPRDFAQPTPRMTGRALLDDWLKRH